MWHQHLVWRTVPPPQAECPGGATDHSAQPWVTSKACRSSSLGLGTGVRRQQPLSVQAPGLGVSNRRGRVGSQAPSAPRGNSTRRGKEAELTDGWVARDPRDGETTLMTTFVFPRSAAGLGKSHLHKPKENSLFCLI